MNYGKLSHQLKKGVTMYRIFIAMILIASCGCTEEHLRLNTHLLVPTVTEIEYDQILENIARTHTNIDSLPNQIILGGGGIQVSDQVSPSFMAPFSGGISNKTASLAYQKQWVENWSVTPVTDPDDLKRLQILYQWACGMNHADKYPQLKKINPATGTPTNSDDLDRHVDITKLLPTDQKWIWFDRPPSTNETLIPGSSDHYLTADKGSYAGVHIWVIEADLSQFVLVALGATPNTIANSSGGGGKPKNQIFLQAE
jgi:hypothetical protein